MSFGSISGHGHGHGHGLRGLSVSGEEGKGMQSRFDLAATSACRKRERQSGYQSRAAGFLGLLLPTCQLPSGRPVARTGSSLAAASMEAIFETRVKSESCPHNTHKHKLTHTQEVPRPNVYDKKHLKRFG